MSISIKKAGVHDMAGVLRLIHELAVFEKEPEAVEITVDDLIAYGTGDNADFVCFVAKDKEEVIGIALVYYRFSTWKGRTIHLEDLIVSENRRGEGIGLKLYSAVIHYAHKQGVKRVEWVVLDWNTNAIDFYEKSGALILRDWNTVQMDHQGIVNFIEKNPFTYEGI